jgi:hypothetical protein
MSATVKKAQKVLNIEKSLAKPSSADFKRKIAVQEVYEGKGTQLERLMDRYD